MALEWQYDNIIRQSPRVCLCGRILEISLRIVSDPGNEKPCERRCILSYSSLTVSLFYEVARTSSPLNKPLSCHHMTSNDPIPPLRMAYRRLFDRCPMWLAAVHRELPDLRSRKPLPNHSWCSIYSGRPSRPSQFFCQPHNF